MSFLLSGAPQSKQRRSSIQITRTILAKRPPCDASRRKDQLLLIPVTRRKAMKSGSDSRTVAGAPLKWRSYPPYYAHIGATLERLDEGECVLRLAPRPELANTKGDIHGGAIASLLDMVLSQAVRSGYDPAFNVATISLNINYLATGNGELRAVGKLIRAGTTIAYLEGEITRPDGAICARAAATYRIIRRPTRSAAAARAQ
jgi:uncharacterized protein (TIGR00369 family)